MNFTVHVLLWCVGMICEQSLNLTNDPEFGLLLFEAFYLQSG